MIVEEYVREDGSCPFRSWFDGLDVQAAAKVATGIVRLELGNISNVKWIGGGLGEYRIDWGPGYRLYLTRDGDELAKLAACPAMKNSSVQSKMRRLARQ